MPSELRNQLAAQLPTSGACFTADTGDCTAPEERFADTFAKWALRGAVSAVRRRLRHARARVAGELGRAAGDAGDRGRGRLAVDRPLVARRARRRAARRA